jgi:hypothetical protein
MKCIKKGCLFTAPEGSNYCSFHRPAAGGTIVRKVTTKSVMRYGGTGGMGTAMKKAKSHAKGKK